MSDSDFCFSDDYFESGFRNYDYGESNNYYFSRNEESEDVFWESGNNCFQEIPREYFQPETLYSDDEGDISGSFQGNYCCVAIDSSETIQSNREFSPETSYEDFLEEFDEFERQKCASVFRLAKIGLEMSRKRQEEERELGGRKIAQSKQLHCIPGKDSPEREHTKEKSKTLGRKNLSPEERNFPFFLPDQKKELSKRNEIEEKREKRKEKAKGKEKGKKWKRGKKEKRRKRKKKSGKAKVMAKKGEGKRKRRKNSVKRRRKSKNGSEKKSGSIIFCIWYCFCKNLYKILFLTLSLNCLTLIKLFHLLLFFLLCLNLFLLKMVEIISPVFLLILFLLVCNLSSSKEKES